MTLPKAAPLRGAVRLSGVVALSVWVSLRPAAAAPAAAPEDVDDATEDALVAVPVGTSSKPVAAPAPAKAELTPSVRLEQPVVEEQWAIPPIPWRARLSIGIDRTKYADADWSGSTTVDLSANATSYVLAPWFLSLNGNSAVSRGRSTSGTVSESANGNLGGGLLPQSRYPGAFSMGIGRSASSGMGGRTESEYRNLSWSQRYVPPDGSFHSSYSASWANIGSGTGSGLGNQVTTKSLSGSSSVHLPGEKAQNFSVSGSANQTTQQPTGNGSSALALDAGHSIYLEDYVMTITSDAGLRRTEVLGEGAGESRFLSAGSQMDWVPSDDYPLRLLGGVRYSALNSSAAGGTSSGERRSTSARLDATYPHSVNWSFSGNLLLNRNEDAAGATTAVIAGAGVNWNGDGIRKKWQEWDYALVYRSALAANYSMVKSNPESPGSEGKTAFLANLNGGIGQSLSKPVDTGAANSRATVSLVQNFDASAPFGETSGGSATATLSHGASFSHSLVSSQTSTVNSSLSARDGRSFGGSRSSYQEISGSVTGTEQLNARESLNWSGTIPLSRQGGGQWKGAVSAGLGYGNGRFANVAGLLYGASYIVSMRRRDDLSEGNFGGTAVNQTFSQSWSWRLGLLSWRIANDYSLDDKDKLTAAIRLSISRDFGGVL